MHAHVVNNMVRWSLCYSRLDNGGHKPHKWLLFLHHWPHLKHNHCTCSPGKVELMWLRMGKTECYACLSLPRYRWDLITIVITVSALSVVLQPVFLVLFAIMWATLLVFCGWLILCSWKRYPEYRIAGIFRKVKFSFVLKTTIFVRLIFILSIKIESMPMYNKIIV